MKNRSWLVLSLAVSLFSFPFLAQAQTIEGEVKSVDTLQKRFEIVTDEDGKTEWVNYEDATVWPDGVSDPKELEGEKVKITVGDENKATEVVEVADTSETPDGGSQASF